MTDLLSSLDRQQQDRVLSQYINDLNSKASDQAKIDRVIQAQKEKNAQYNSTLEAVTEPLAQEVLREPVKDLSKRVFKSIVSSAKSRVNNSLNDLADKGVEYVKNTISKKAEELNIDPENLKNLLNGTDPSQMLAETQQNIFSKIQDAKNSVKLASQAVPTTLDEESARIVNAGKAISGIGNMKPSAKNVSSSPKQAEPQDFNEDAIPEELDPFTGEKIDRSSAKPDFSYEDPDDATDWTHELYDKPITQANLPPPDVSLPPPLAPEETFKPIIPSEPENPFSYSAFEQGAGAFKDVPEAGFGTPQARLDYIFKNDDNIKNVDFKFKSITQPRPLPKPDVDGDVAVRDQLAPMRDLLKSSQMDDIDAVQQFKPSDVQKILASYNRSASIPSDQLLKPPEPPKIKPSPSPEDGVAPEEGVPKDERPASVTPDDDQQDDSSSDVRDTEGDIGKSVEGDADDMAEKTGTNILKNAGEDALEETAEITTLGGGVEDPISDIIGLAVGLGTLFGGIFGGHHSTQAPDTPEASPVNPSYQDGVS